MVQRVPWNPFLKNLSYPQYTLIEQSDRDTLIEQSLAFSVSVASCAAMMGELFSAGEDIFYFTLQLG